MNFFRYNSNPKGWKTGDCVVRAVSTAMEAAYKNMNWNNTYNDLCAIGAKKCRMPNDSHVYGQYLRDNWFIECKQLKHDDGTKYTVKEVISEYPNSILLINCAHHLTCAVRGNLYDTWDCSYKTAGKFWLMDNCDIMHENVDVFEERMLPYLDEDCRRRIL